MGLLSLKGNFFKSIFISKRFAKLKSQTEFLFQSDTTFTVVRG